MTEEKKNLPAAKVRSGQFEVATWENEAEKDGNKFKTTSFTLRKSWKDKEDKWQEQKISLNKEDALKVALALQEAYKTAVIKTE